MSLDQKQLFGIVIIGRNEGERLRQCLKSLPRQVPIVYVDSGSTDGSCEFASQFGATVVLLDSDRPFTAARARNTGFRQLLEIAPDTSLVQFVDGDCTLTHGWLETAIQFILDRPEVAAVCGRLREKFPTRSLYNRFCDLEWDAPIGETKSCGGIALVRSAAFQQVGGFRDDLIAGEEPELCVRLRAANWRIFNLDAEMALHDANMLYFWQWWRRAVRCGYGFAEGAYLHGAGPEQHWKWEARRGILWGAIIPAVCLAMVVLAWPYGLATILIFPLQILRLTVRNKGDLGFRVQLACFQVLGKFAEAFGHIKFIFSRLLGRTERIIEYK